MRRLLLTLLCCAALAACRDYDFGDQAKTFVDTEAYKASKDTLTADLSNRWPNYFKGALVQLSIELTEIVLMTPDLTRLDEIKVDPSGESSAVKAILFADAAIPRVREAQERLDELAKDQLELSAVCTNRATYFRLEIDEIPKISPLGSVDLPQHELRIYISTTSSDSDSNSQNDGDDANDNEGGGDFWYSLWSSLESIWGQSRYDQQLEHFQEAVKDYPKKVVQDDEAFKISTGICTKAKAQAAGTLEQLGKAIQEQQLMFRQAEAALRQMQSAAEVRLSPELIRRTAADAGVLSELQRWRTQELHGRMLRDLGGRLSELESLRRDAIAAKNCFALRSADEETTDAAAEFDAEVGALIPAIGDPAVRSRFLNRRARVQMAQAAYKVAIAKRARELCS